MEANREKYMMMEVNIMVGDLDIELTMVMVTMMKMINYAGVGDWDYDDGDNDREGDENDLVGGKMGVEEMKFNSNIDVVVNEEEEMNMVIREAMLEGT